MSEVGRSPMIFHKQVEKLLQSRDSSRGDTMYQFEGKLSSVFSLKYLDKRMLFVSLFKKTLVRNLNFYIKKMSKVKFFII